jgi:hypothetical protein
MSEQRPMSSEERSMLLSHDTGRECRLLCESLEDLNERYDNAEGQPALQQRILVQIKAVLRRMEALDCRPCLFE